MGVVLLFRGHRWAHCDTRTCNGCHLCHGGLGVCRTCGGMEGSLTTHCPQVVCNSLILDAVYDAQCDFRNGEWVPGPSDTWQHISRGR